MPPLHKAYTFPFLFWCGIVIAPLYTWHPPPPRHVMPSTQLVISTQVGHHAYSHGYLVFLGAISQIMWWSTLIHKVIILSLKIGCVVPLIYKLGTFPFPCDVELSQHLYMQDILPNSSLWHPHHSKNEILWKEMWYDWLIYTLAKIGARRLEWE